MINTIRRVFMMYVMMGLEEDWWLHNSVTATKKPNLVYRLYKAVNREFRLDANEYVFGGDLFSLLTKSVRWFGW